MKIKENTIGSEHAKYIHVCFPSVRHMLHQHPRKNEIEASMKFVREIVCGQIKTGLANLVRGAAELTGGNVIHNIVYIKLGDLFAREERPSATAEFADVFGAKLADQASDDAVEVMIRNARKEASSE